LASIFDPSRVSVGLVSTRSLYLKYKRKSEATMTDLCPGRSTHSSLRPIVSS